MCGICGIVALGGPALEASATRCVEAMVEALAHRGPDQVGIEQGEGAVFGATRLAIRGLEDGRQPILDPPSGLLVACNGEIDNGPELRAWLARRGRATANASDVGVIPGLYLELGEEFVERLEGAFALAVWDPRLQRLLLARDRAGERPLFYACDGRRVRFATETAALAVERETPLVPDRNALAGYVSRGYFSAPETPFTGIRKVGPSEIILFAAEQPPRGRRYWRWPIVTREKRPPSADDFDRIFRRAVRRQSEVEVSYGVFLSGGIDSSLVAAVLRAERPQQRFGAYTLRFAEDSYDEGGYAEMLARHLGCEFRPVWVTPEAFPGMLAELIGMVGEPLADPAWVPTALLARRAAEEVKLALVGEGADEIFGGYPTYMGAWLAGAYARLPRPLARVIRQGIERLPVSDRKVTVSFLLRRFVAGAKLEGLTRHRLWTASVSPEIARRLGLEGGAAEPAAAPGGEPLEAREVDDAIEAHQAMGPPELLDLLQRHDLETSLAEGLLTKADRAGMKSALELRAPFLDREVLEFAATLPARERVHGWRTKVFLKRFALRYLPAEIVHRRKRGLSVPLSAWLRGPLRAWAESRLGDRRLAGVGLSPQGALGLFEEHCERRADHARALWTVIVLDEWLRWADLSAGRATPTARAALAVGVKGGR